MKPNKSILKRIRVSKTGKIRHLKSGRDHFNAKASRRQQRRQNQSAVFTKAIEKKIRQMI